MQAYLNGSALLGAEIGPRTAKTSAERYETLKRLPVSELKVRADRVVAELRKWQTNVLADDNARAYAAVLDQTLWQKANGDLSSDVEERRLAYARAIHMAEDALLAFTSLGPGDSYWDTYLETLKKGAELTRDALQSLAGAPGKTFEWLTGVPSWVFWVGSLGLVTGLVYGIWRITIAATPAVAGAVARRYLP